MIYLKMAEHIYNGEDKETAYMNTKNDIINLWKLISFEENEQQHFKHIILSDIRNLQESDLRSGGYVIEVLESSFYYFLTKQGYANTVLAIINLGHDTDTSAAILGGLAGLYYGYDDIPSHWLEKIVKYDKIKKLIHDFAFSIMDMR